MESLDHNGLNLKKINPPHHKINPYISVNCVEPTTGPTNPVNQNMFQEHHTQAQHYKKNLPFPNDDITELDVQAFKLLKSWKGTNCENPSYNFVWTY